jgi:FkbM family methyltransferase
VNGPGSCIALTVPALRRSIQANNHHDVTIERQWGYGVRMEPSAGIVNSVLSYGSRVVRSRVNALRLGFVIKRGQSFAMPAQIRVGSKKVVLHYPPDHGASSDFLACLLRNDYGLRRQLGQVKTILDIGANVGFFSIAARWHYPDAAIHAYEPNPRSLPYLKSNVSQLAVAVHPEAVGAADGMVSISDSGDTNLARTEATQNGNIPQVSLSTAIERMGGAIDLLKLDCEGAEWEMFRQSSCWHSVRNIRMEYHLFHGETVEEVDETLDRLGFETIKWETNEGFGVVWAKGKRRN